ncbi:MAG: Stage V sporulation protein B [candidate division WS2 bacterium]|uniref:Stage V sporulation protein B n=1 Tax=Psychracetigena formicireducens TaxID=2986056 RepID=A0A9E2BGT9_PSYF1|nr:Stage V sporulation protein B [Candidatus Psychracetigena formicireducens]MBT9150550.1 Stage V sporulation protein B [Candidatus Psychracetigena formicireducens]
MTARKFAFDVSWVFLSQIITLATGFLLSVILGRFLGAAPFGLFTMTFTIYTIASLVGEMGIPPAIVKYVAEFKENKEKLNIFVSCGVVNSVIFGAIAGAVLFTLSNTLANIFNMPELAELIRIIAFSLPFLVVNNMLIGLLNGLREMKSYSLRTVIRSSLLLSLTILFVGSGFGIEGAVLALLLSEVGTLFLLIFISRNFFSFVIRDYMKTTKELVGFGSQLFLASAIYMVNTYTDTLLVGFFLTDKDVGIYAIAIALSKVFLVIPGSMSAITYPAISEYNSKGSHEAIENLINKSMKYSLIILSTLGVLIIFFSKHIILLLFKPEFLPAVTPITILILGMIFFGSMSSVGAAFSAVNRPDIPFKLNLFAVVVNLSLNIILIPILGITGAAIATATSFSVLTILALYLLNRILNVKIDIQWYAKILATIALVIAAFFIFKYWINLYLLIGILFGCYLMLVNKLLLTNEDKKDFWKIVKQILKKSTD